MDPSRTLGVADHDTLRRARHGDTDALADLWTIYQPQILRLLGSRGRATAEDISSQVWLDVGRSIERFEGDGDAFRSWVFTIAHRRAIDENRRTARQQELATESLSTLVAACREIDPLDGSLDGVLGLLATLQPSAAEVLVLRVLHDLPVTDVAAMTGRSEGNVRVLAHRALARLRATIEDLGDQPPASMVAVPRLSV